MATLVLDRLHLGAMANPSDSTDPPIWQPATVLSTNDVFKEGEWIFGANNAAAPTTKISIYGGFRVPVNYVGSPVIIVEWTATIITGDVVWDFDYRGVGGNDTTSLDQATFEESVTVTDTAPGATDRRMEVNITGITASFLTAGEWCQFAFSRDGADAADTMAGSARLRNLSFQYADA